MDSKKITKWVNFLKDFAEEETAYLAMALDKHNGIMNAADPENYNKNVRLDGALQPHVFRANVQEGWIESFIDISDNIEELVYKEYDGCVVRERKYGKVEII